MPKIEFVGQSAKDSGNPAANPSRLLNFYREPVISGGRTGYILRSVAGVQEFADFGRLFVYAMEEIDGKIYAVCGGRLFRVSENGDVDDLAAIPVDPRTTISGNNGKIAITADGRYFVWDGTAIAEIAATAVNDVGSCAYLGGYTVVAQRDGRLAQWSQLVDAAILPALNVRASETTDADIVRVMTINERLVVFKENSLEQWQVTGRANENAIALIVGSNSEVGLKGFNLVTLYPNGAAFVASDGKVYAWAGGQTQPISTPPVEVAVEAKRPSACFFYEQRGHGFICVTFRDAPAWCYDMATGEWHERADGILGENWSATASAKLGQRWYLGYNSGKIGLTNTTPTDFGGPLRRVAVSRTLWTGARFTVPKLEFFGHAGVVPYLPGFTDAPTMAARFSRDGLTFGPEKQRSLGDQGKLDHTITFRALGQFRSMTVEIAMADPVETPLYADCNVEVA